MAVVRRTRAKTLKGKAKEVERRPSLRDEIRERIERYTNIPIVLASVLMLLLSIIQLTDPHLTPSHKALVSVAVFALWAFLLVETAVLLILAPDTKAYIRGHWLALIALAVPFLGVLRIFSAASGVAPALRIAIFGGRHSSKALEILQRRHLGQLTLISIFVIFIAACAEFLVEAGTPGANIQSFGDALWYSAATATTVGAQLYPVTTPGKIFGFLLMIYAVCVFTYFMAAIASVLVSHDEQKDHEKGSKGEG